MKALVYTFVILAIVSLVAGIFSRITLTPLNFGLYANALLKFTNTCLLFAIAFGLIHMLKSK